MNVLLKNFLFSLYLQKFNEFELQTSVSESDDRSSFISTKDIVESAPTTPHFLPSVDKSEHIIQETLKEHRALHRSNTSPSLPQPYRKVQRSLSVTDQYPEENSNFYIGREKDSETDVNENSKLNPSLNRELLSKKTPSPRHRRSLSTTAVQTSFDENSNPFDELQGINKHVSQGTNTTDSLERPRKRNKSGSDVDRLAPIKKPTDFPQALVRGNRMGAFFHDQSPEMQVMVASTSPVLFRRKPSAKGRNRPRLPANEIYCNNAQNMINNMDTVEMELELRRQEEFFLKKDVSQTWHGSTANKWKKLYAPVAEQLANHHHIENGFQTLPSKTSLLDEMHKKYCAYQYQNKTVRNIVMIGTLPPKFQSSPPPPDRMKSRSWLLQHYTIPLPTSSTSSPDSPKVNKRLKEDKNVRGKKSSLIVKEKIENDESDKPVSSPSEEEKEVPMENQELASQEEAAVEMRKKAPAMVSEGLVTCLYTCTKIFLIVFIRNSLDDNDMQER